MIVFLIKKMMYNIAHEQKNPASQSSLDMIINGQFACHLTSLVPLGPSGIYYLDYLRLGAQKNSDFDK
jgi:hypothetical protein